MIRPALVFAALLSLPGCREEPTIVITFAPQDASARTALVDLGRPADLARSPDLGISAATANEGDPCKRDADCAIEKADCCGCKAGGKAKAIGRARRKEWEKSLAARCASTMCAAMISSDPTCAETAKCVLGRCALRLETATAK